MVRKIAFTICMVAVLVIAAGTAVAFKGMNPEGIVIEAVPKTAYSSDDIFDISSLVVSSVCPFGRFVIDRTELEFLFSKGVDDGIESLPIQKLIPGESRVSVSGTVFVVYSGFMDSYEITVEGQERELLSPYADLTDVPIVVPSENTSMVEVSASENQETTEQNASEIEVEAEDIVPVEPIQITPVAIELYLSEGKYKTSSVIGQDFLDLLAVDVYYSDGSTISVPYSDFAEKDIIISKKVGEVLYGSFLSISVKMGDLTDTLDIPLRNIELKSSFAGAFDDIRMTVIDGSELDAPEIDFRNGLFKQEGWNDRLGNNVVFPFEIDSDVQLIEGVRLSSGGQKITAEKDHILKIADGSVLALGSNLKGETAVSSVSGSGISLHFNTVTGMDQIDDAWAVASYGMASFIITEDGYLYASGDNSNAVLGIDNGNMDVALFTPVAGVQGVVGVYPIADVTYVLTADGSILRAGYIQGRYVRSFEMLDAGMRVMDMAVADSILLALGSDGFIYELTGNGSIFTRLDFNEAVACFDVSDSLAAIMDSNGNIYLRGSLPDGNVYDSFTLFSSVDSITGIENTDLGNVDIYVSDDYVVLKVDDVLYGYGTNAYGQLGIGGSVATFVFTPLMFSNPTSIDCKSDAVYLIDEAGVIYWAGQSIYGNVDHPAEMSVGFSKAIVSFNKDGKLITERMYSVNPVLRQELLTLEDLRELGAVGYECDFASWAENGTELGLSAIITGDKNLELVEKQIFTVENGIITGLDSSVSYGDRLIIPPYIGDQKIVGISEPLLHTLTCKTLVVSEGITAFAYYRKNGDILERIELPSSLTAVALAGERMASQLIIDYKGSMDEFNAMETNIAVFSFRLIVEE